jgi:hypothetical protein
MARNSDQIRRRSAMLTAALCCLGLTLTELFAQFDDAHAEPHQRFVAVQAIHKAAKSTPLKSLQDCLAVDTDRTVSCATMQTPRRSRTQTVPNLLLKDPQPTVQPAVFLAPADYGQMIDAIAVPLESALPMAQLWLKKKRSGSETWRLPIQPLPLALSSGERLIIRKDSIEERWTARTSAMPDLNSRLRHSDVAGLTAFLLTRQNTVGKVNTTESAKTPPGIRQQPDRLILSDRHGLIGEFVYRDEKIRRPYLTRLQTLSGKQVTRNHPPVEGTDATDHDTMHPGIWLGFGDFAGSDFWRNKGTIDHVRLTNMTTTTDGLLTFSAEARLLDEERRELGQITNHLQIKTFDDIRLLVWEAAFYSDTQDLVFGDQEEMGLGARVATPLTEKNGGVVSNSEGLQTAEKTWGQPADWCDYSGQVDGQRIGITLMSSPTNFRRSWWHNRDYGVFVANPFGRKAMQQGTPSRIIIPRGQKFRISFGAAIHAARDYEPQTAWQRFLPLVKASPSDRTATEQ